MQALRLIDSWPVDNVAATVVRPDGSVESAGDQQRPFRIASVAKTITTWACLVAVEEGIVTLDQPVGQPGCTLAAPAVPRRWLRVRRHRAHRPPRTHTHLLQHRHRDGRVHSRQCRRHDVRRLPRRGRAGATGDVGDGVARLAGASNVEHRIRPDALRPRGSTAAAHLRSDRSARRQRRSSPCSAASSPVSEGSRRAPGVSVSRCVAPNSRTGPAQRTRRRRLDISVAPVPSYGWILPWGWPASH